MKFLRKFSALALLLVLIAAPVAAVAGPPDSSYLLDVYLERGNGRVVSQAGGGAVYNERFHVSIANVNAGLTLLPARVGLKYRLVDSTIIAVGGAVATCTAVTLNSTQATAGAVIQSVAVAALTQSTIVKPNTANSTVLADGASFAVNDVNTAVTIAKTGSSCATATFVDVILSYAIETP